MRVLGRGTPLVYVDGRRLSHQKELAEIKASQVKQVQVILNPGSKYPSGVSSVVHITTIRTQSNGLSGMVQASARVNKRFSHDEYLSLNYRKGGLDIFGTMYYADKNRGKNNPTTWPLPTILKATAPKWTATKLGKGNMPCPHWA